MKIAPIKAQTSQERNIFMTIGFNKPSLDLRERFMTFGPKHLSDTELLAAFIGSGTRYQSCLQIAHELLDHFGDLRQLLQAEFKQFQTIKGIGAVRFIQMKAMVEMCHRRDYIALKKADFLSDSKAAYHFIKRLLRDKKNETLCILFLDKYQRVICYDETSHGSLDFTQISLRAIIDKTLSVNAAALILAHNHPSGSITMSASDKNTTKRLKKALAFIEVMLLDHLIIGDNQIYSMMQAQSWSCY
ncbi:MAG: hypothetical protein CMF38_02860 [Legionellaceae bacterium]|nr:hypothetical protein [Legionellaceae bacterium]HAF87626.1 hypothetical protein [Legionellales bacterium]HCA88832.1 hypothetical protein [Legionellales bacterium]